MSSAILREFWYASAGCHAKEKIRSGAKHSAALWVQVALWAEIEGFNISRYLGQHLEVIYRGYIRLQKKP